MFRQVLYVNICLHESIDRSEAETVEGKGQNWKLPHFVGKQRLDQDVDIGTEEQKTIVTVIDVAFNPNIKEYCLKSRAFKKMISDVAIQGVNQKLSVKKEKANVDYAISKLECKGESPSLMPIKIGSERSENPEHPKLYHEITQLKESQKKDKQEESREEEVEEERQASEELKYPISPKYKIVEVHDSGTDFLQTHDDRSARPQKIRLEV